MAALISRTFCIGRFPVVAAAADCDAEDVVRMSWSEHARTRLGVRGSCSWWAPPGPPWFPKTLACSALSQKSGTGFSLLESLLSVLGLVFAVQLENLLLVTSIAPLLLRFSDLLVVATLRYCWESYCCMCLPGADMQAAPMWSSSFFAEALLARGC